MLIGLQPGTAPGCKATGENPNGQWGGFCEELLEPTLKSIDQLSIPKFYFDGDCDGPVAARHYKNDTKECAKDMEYRQNEVDKGNISASIYAGNPWFVPGTAPLVDSCGVLGGWKFSDAREDPATVSILPPKNMDPPAGTLGSTVLSWEVNMRMQNAQGDSVAAYPTVWTSGEIVEGSYAINANHGGGHQYRLCPLDNLINNTLDETCFQATVMEFASDKSLFIVTSDDGTTTVNITFDAMDINDDNTDGVMPKGSTWRKLGIPPCKNISQNNDGSFSGNCTEPQFTDHAPPGYYGYGAFGNSPDLKLLNVITLLAENGIEQHTRLDTVCYVTIVDPENMLGDGDSDDNDNNNGKCESLDDIVCDGKDFILFCDALKAAKLDSSFDKEMWTFFIPNDDAFEKAGETLEPLSNDTVNNILMFHAVPGKILNSDDLKCGEKIEMFNGDSSRTKCINSAMYQNGAGNTQLMSSPQIIQTDIKFCNGVAHVVDGVMFPKFG
ncbi:hypothetical protein FRACYDRAFT_255838 [Fragilariopsis cylindrus CCMP1102]|uniref:FAS1 domain-containing protein n=1 Tax=Fragilariopsis cylindrus CCMP1102 TaxID=635003 RepID=A0A1E7EJV0_9STRA|nr:hypothetical protein FRACYDRAFT_255838 [Fragilariopsis cylindrus CCMP1102]|eukprot:OEU06180.1 hypothetical protein FRACYDRAFT_255838 [Fragilariopsis cylindrus CCMP1102]